LTGVTTGISYFMPGEFDDQFVSLAYTAAEYDSKLPVGTLGDPYAQVTRDPHRGFLGIMTLGYGYSNVDGTLYDVGAERGYSVSASLDLTSTETGSEDSLAAFNLRTIGYVPMPWLQHHTLA